MSLTTSQIKFLSSLGQKKFREHHGLFVVEGVKMVEEAIHQSHFPLKTIYGTSEWIGKNGFLLKDPSLEIVEIKEKELKRISNLKNPNQAFCVCEKSDFSSDKKLKINDLALYLDRIKDPGNMGTILRIADWFGIENVILSPESVEIFNPKVVQATMGAIFRVSIFEKDFDSFFEAHSDLKFFATSMSGTDVFKMKKTKKSVVIIGNESHGISEEIMKRVEEKIAIPTFKKSRSESLNAAVATGIICSAFRNL